MGLFSSIGNAISSITDPVGALLNGVTGATHSAKTAQKNALQQTAVNQANSKEMAAINQKYALQSMAKQYQYEKAAALQAYQWQVQDLQKAGLNPILGIASGGASADTGITAGGGTPGTGSGGGHGISSGLDIFGSATNIARTIKELQVMEANKETAKAQKDNLDADTANKIEENPLIKPKRKAEIANLTAQTKEHSAKAISEEGTKENFIGTLREMLKNQNWIWNAWRKK